MLKQIKLYRIILVFLIIGAIAATLFIRAQIEPTTRRPLPPPYEKWKKEGFPTVLSRGEVAALYQAYRLIEDGKYDEAIRLLEPIEKRYPYEIVTLFEPIPGVDFRDVVPNFLLTSCYHCKGNLAKVIEMGEKKARDIDQIVQSALDFARKEFEAQGLSTDWTYEPKYYNHYKNELLGNLSRNLPKLRKKLAQTNPKALKPYIVLDPRNGKVIPSSNTELAKGDIILAEAKALSKLLQLDCKLSKGFIFRRPIRATLKNQKLTLDFEEGSKQVRVNKLIRQLKQAPKVIGGELYLPLEDVVLNQLGYKITWTDKQLRIASLYSTEAAKKLQRRTIIPSPTKAPAVTPKYNPMYNE